MAVRFVSYNIHKAVGLDYRRDPARILDVLNGLDADIVALQEADRRLGPRPCVLPRFLIAQETDFQIARVATNEESLGWHGNAILVRRNHAVLETSRFHLPGLEPRGAVMVRVECRGHTLNVFGVHLALLRRWRMLQLTTLRNHMEDAGADNSVLLGDFNEWAVRGGTVAIDDLMTVVAPGRSFHAARPLAPLDRIAFGSSLSLGASGVDRSALARVASDHLPIWADLHVT